MSYIKFNLPDELKKEIINVIEKIADAKDSKIRKGMNEVTKSIERGNAKFVVMAEDVNPPEILFHIPLLCEEKGVPYGYIQKKSTLGKTVKINVATSAIAVENIGTGNEGILEEIIKKIEAVKK
ncbi:MAG: ribosomal L7Ae/L30e/S12e/Gadd45 family protein [Promethearchaeota archaeon]